MPSKQPRFGADESPTDIFSTMMHAFESIDPEPPYSSDSRKRDLWLRNFVNKEPHLSGIVSSVAAIDKNRGWSLVGGRNMVKRVSEMFHDFQVAPGLKGWRPACAFLSSAFWGTNMGAVTEIGRDGANGPAISFYTVDPTKCSLSTNNSRPLKYYPAKGKLSEWRTEDFFRVTSIPSTDETFNGLGYCSVDRAVQLAQLMLALYRHDEEMLGARAPRGLLLLSGIKREQWTKAMEAQKDELDDSMMQYFGSIAVLASAATSVDAKLVALSQLPAGFDLKIWTDMVMYGYSLCFGYDPSEFYPVQYGALGRGNEVQLQHEKATGKGRLEFTLGFQEQVQEVIPESLEFLFEQRDDQGDLLRASVHQAWANVVKTLYTATSTEGLPLITNEEARVKLAEYGIIPTTWSPTAEPSASDQEDLDDDPVLESPEDEKAKADAASTNGTTPPETGKPKATDTASAKPSAQYLRPSFKTSRLNLLREQYLEKQSTHIAARHYPDEAIVMYTYPGNNVIELWPSGMDVLRPVYQSVGDTPVRIKKDKPSIVVQPQIHITMPQQEYPAPVINIPAPIVNVEAQKAPIIHVPAPIINVPESQITVNVPETQVHVNLPVPQINVAAPVINQAASPAPIVNITVPPAEVTVNVPPAEVTVNVEAPQVTVEVPAPEVVVNNMASDEKGKETFTVVRDSRGEISRVEKSQSK